MNILRRTGFFLLVALLLTGGEACGGPQEHLISGRTMGTTYHIKFISRGPVDLMAVQAKVDARLEKINQEMSTFRPESEISRFNEFSKTNTPFKVSVDFWRVMETAREIYRLTGGAWDGTVNPLVNLWGFGKAGPLRHVPSAQQVRQALQRVGFGHIEVGDRGVLIKKRADVSVDLASIAKGYGVDRLAALFKEMGYHDYLVEVGGEVYAAGRRQDGAAWRVGINRPRPDASATAVYKVLHLDDLALATSGDYRNFYEIDGRSFSHIIDPRTGYPLENGVVSASVVANTCTLADGLATALMVMGPEKGIALVDSLPGVEAMIVVRRPDGGFADYLSHGMAHCFE